VIIIIIVVSKRKGKTYKMKADKHTEDAVLYTNKNDEQFTKPLAVNSPVYSSEGVVFENPTYSVCSVS